MPAEIDFSSITLSPLSETHSWEGFSCGDETVDKWFRAHSHSYHDKFSCRVTLVYHGDAPNPVGAYVLSLRSVDQKFFKATARDYFSWKPPPQFPALNLDWLAVCKDHQGLGLGRYIMGLVTTDFYNCIQSYGLQALTLEAIDQKTEDFYKRLGFNRYAPAVLGRKMILGAKPVLDLQAAFVANSAIVELATNDAA